MRLENTFVVGAGIDQTWIALTDLERITPCLPGAVLEGRDGDAYVGNLKIKVGPITARFRGSAQFTHKDATGYTAVLSASGKDVGASAPVSAQIFMRMEPVDEQRTRVQVDTDLQISGRMAQFGRGAIADVSGRLIAQFVDNLSAGVLNAPTETSYSGVAVSPAVHPSTGAHVTPPDRVVQPAAADIDLVSVLFPIIRHRYGQAIAGALGGFVLSWLVFGRQVRR